MNMKKMTKLLMGLVVSVGLISSASAVTLQVGDSSFTIENFDFGTTYMPGTCTDIASCDALAATGFPIANSSGTNADTFGIFKVGIIKDGNGQQTFSSGQSGQFLTGVFGGLHDYLVTNNGTTTTAFATGGFFKLYQNSTDYNPGLGNAAFTATGTYAGITGGTLLLDAVFSASPDSSQPTATFVTNFDSNQLAGSSSSFLDIVGTAGLWNAMFNTNKKIDSFGNAHDIFFNDTFSRNQLASGLLPKWTVESAGTASANIPEPASLALLGLGLAGLACARRRKTKTGSAVSSLAVA